MKNETAMTATRYDTIMARVDAWAENHEGYDCRADATEEVVFMLNHADYVNYSDEEIAWAAISAWEAAE
jgi:hypothetical protein